MRSFRRIGIVILWLAVLIVAAETFQRAIEPNPNRYYTFPPGSDFSLDIDSAILAGVAPGGRFKVNEIGLRGRMPGGEKLRILVLGGSTVENIVQDEATVWTAVLDTAISNWAGPGAVWVGNAGRSGITSFENLLQLRHLDDMVPGVRIAVVLIGFNDMAYGLRNANRDALEPVTESERYSRTFFVVQNEARDFPRNLALYRLFVAVRRWSDFAARGDAQTSLFRPDSGVYMRWLVDTRRAQITDTNQVEDPPDLTTFLAIYRANLDAMIRSATTRGVRLVLATQPVAFRPNQPDSLRATYGWSGWIDVPRADGSRRRFHYSPGALYEAMTRYNTTTLAACAEYRLVCVDLGDVLPPTAEYFFDGLHLTDRGNEAVARAVFDSLRAAGYLPPRRM